MDMTAIRVEAIAQNLSAQANMLSQALAMKEGDLAVLRAELQSAQARIAELEKAAPIEASKE